VSLGTILTSVAAFVLVVAYVARPFRRERVDIDRVISRWVRQMRSDAVAADDAFEPAGVDAGATVQRDVDPSVSHVAAEAMDQSEPVNFCPYCGRRVESDHVFCPKCGRRLAEGDL